MGNASPAHQVRRARPTTAGLDVQWQGALLDLLARSHLLAGDTVAATLDEVLTPLRLHPEL